jgi:hypothetical protein
MRGRQLKIVTAISLLLCCAITVTWVRALRRKQLDLPVVLSYRHGADHYYFLFSTRYGLTLQMLPNDYFGNSKYLTQSYRLTLYAFFWNGIEKRSFSTGETSAGIFVSYWLIVVLTAVLPLRACVRP